MLQVRHSLSMTPGVQSAPGPPVVLASRVTIRTDRAPHEAHDRPSPARY